MEQKKNSGVTMTHKEACEIARFIYCEIAAIVILLVTVIGLIIALCAKPKSVVVEVPVEVPVEVHIKDIEYVEVVTEVVTPSGTAKYTLNLDDYADCFTRQDVEQIAQAIYGEAETVKSMTEKAAVGWVILNQVDSNADGMRNYNSIQDVLKSHSNIQGYWAVDGETIPDSYKKLAYDILCRYYAEKDGWDNVGRIIPADYLYWMGDGMSHNYFTIEYHEGSLTYCKNNAWNWTLTSPYAN